MTMMSIFGLFIVTFLISAIVIVLVLVITQSTKGKENQQMRTRHTNEPQTRMTNSRVHDNEQAKPQVQTVVLIIICVVVFIGGVYLVRQNNLLKEDVNRINDKLSYLEQNLGYSRSDISTLNQRIEQLQREDDYVNYVTYDLVELDDQGNALVDLSVYMQRMPIDEEATLFVEDSTGDITAYPIVSDTMIFQTTLTLDLRETYDFYVVVNDGEYLISEDVLTLDIGRQVQRYKGIKFEEEWLEEQIELQFVVFNDYSVSELLKFKEVWFEVYYDQELTSTIMLSVADIDVNDYQEFHHSVMVNLGEEVFMVKIIGVDYLEEEYVLFEEGW